MSDEKPKVVIKKEVLDADASKASAANPPSTVVTRSGAIVAAQRQQKSHKSAPGGRVHKTTEIYSPGDSATTKAPPTNQTTMVKASVSSAAKPKKASGKRQKTSRIRGPI